MRSAYEMFEHCYFHQRELGAQFMPCAACGEEVSAYWLPLSLHWSGYCKNCCTTVRVQEPKRVKCPQCKGEG